MPTEQAMLVLLGSACLDALYLELLPADLLKARDFVQAAMAVSQPVFEELLL